jgi:hypothetical protein
LFTVDLQLSAQAGRIVATIPFDFTVGDIWLERGLYEVHTGLRGTVLLRNPKTTWSAIFITVPNRSLGGDEPRLSFTQYGRAYFLNQVDWPGYEKGLKLHPGKAELELARRQAPEHITIAAIQP